MQSGYIKYTFLCKWGSRVEKGDFDQVLDQNGSTIQFPWRKFPKISEAKITAGILNGP